MHISDFVPTVPHLLERADVSQHVRESGLSSFALRMFRAEFRRQKELQKSYALPAFHNASVTKQDWELLSHLVIYPDFSAKHMTAYVKAHSHLIIGMYFAMPNIYDKAKAYVESEDFASIFRHEFQHFIDFAGKDTVYNSPDDPHEYVNNDVEYAAWFKQLAEPLLKILRDAEAGDYIGEKTVDPDFEHFMRSGQHFGIADHRVPLNKFSPQYKKRYLRDLHALHAAVCKVEGATAQYQPSLAAKVLKWLSDKTGIGG